MTFHKIPDGLDVIPDHLLDLRPDDRIDHDLLHPLAVTDEKNVWFFWHAGYAQMPPYHQRTVRAYHRRMSKLGWAIRVVDVAGGPLLASSSSESPTHISHFVAVDAANFPEAFRHGTLSGDYARQHYSDLVRWPLLLRHGGIYADVGFVQIGDLDRLWRETLGNPASPYEVISYGHTLSNYFLAARPGNALFTRCHRLFLALWAADGGHTTTTGMHASPLLRGLPLMGSDSMTITDPDGRVHEPDEVRRMLTDYIIQGQVMALVMGLVDDADGWDGPAYARQHVYAIDFLEGSQLINGLTNWDGPRQFALLSQQLPVDGETENADQRSAREIVEQCLTRSFGFKLATGLILRVMGDTLSSLWRRNEGSDVAPGTYAAWFRYGTVHWTQRRLPAPLTWEEETEPIKKGGLNELELWRTTNRPSKLFYLPKLPAAAPIARRWLSQQIPSGPASVASSRVLRQRCHFRPIRRPSLLCLSFCSHFSRLSTISTGAPALSSFLQSLFFFALVATTRAFFFLIPPSNSPVHFSRPPNKTGVPPTLATLRNGRSQPFYFILISLFPCRNAP